ncbi:type IV pilus modification PilV family protein [Neptunomonas japonica]|uniref:MSHA pilin protein MshD n=1 Tax=Neptunomonas japonica JAMM 1380 TaxID=1441457 RepID=A0A7R6PJT8_9GAMM|nr:type II secretion system protein [Neptunomonas japonica]BBB31507.1 MSHA pilin protein MshD [Neptunomonas japonica JAMM 1380]
MKASASESGFSLVETILTIVIISISLVVLVSAWGQSARQSADPFWHAKAAYLGQAYIEEILTKRYDENTPVGGQPACSSSTCSTTLGAEAGETRALFDDVDDYNGLNETPSQNALGVVRPEYNNYQVEVNISYAGGDLGVSATTMKRINVTVTPPGESPQQFVVYRGNY